ncbi:MAG: hypothetical protein FWG87_05280 [Defluviitaleaceae bacterium]|nr:hypothetical protein [Defluviitaleaceae bacterium]
MCAYEATLRGVVCTINAQMAEACSFLGFKRLFCADLADLHRFTRILHEWIFARTNPHNPRKSVKSAFNLHLSGFVRLS